MLRMLRYSIYAASHRKCLLLFIHVVAIQVYTEANYCTHVGHVGYINVRRVESGKQRQWRAALHQGAPVRSSNDINKKQAGLSPSLSEYYFIC